MSYVRDAPATRQLGGCSMSSFNLSIGERHFREKRCCGFADANLIRHLARPNIGGSGEEKLTC